MNSLLHNIATICLMCGLISPAFAQEVGDLFARDSYRIDTIICPFKGEIEYEPGDIECGLLEVPENREDPDSRFIELHFVKLNSRWGKDDDEDDDDEEDEDDEDDEDSEDQVVEDSLNQQDSLYTPSVGNVILDEQKQDNEKEEKSFCIYYFLIFLLVH